MKRLPLFTLALAVILLVFDFLLVGFYTASKLELLYFAITPGIAHFLAAFTVTGSVLVSCSLIYWFRKDRLEQAAKEKLIAELSESERRFRELFDLSQAFICIHTPEGIITSVNQRAVQSLGYSREEMVGRPLESLIPDKFKNEYLAYLRRINNEGIASGLLELLKKSGEILVIRYHNVLVMEKDSPYILASGQDVTELLKVQEQLRTLSLTDELTGLYNRRGFLTLAEQQLRLERHSGTRRGLKLLFADMDGLKEINDRFGHEAGSEAIKTLSTLIKSIVREADIVARWGGDEFVIMVIGAERGAADKMIERIQSKINEYNLYSGKPYKVDCSIGLTDIPSSDQINIADLLEQADKKMYEEKQRRKSGRIEQRPSDDIHTSNSFAWY